MSEEDLKAELYEMLRMIQEIKARLPQRAGSRSLAPISPSGARPEAGHADVASLVMRLKDIASEDPFAAVEAAAPPPPVNGATAPGSVALSHRQAVQKGNASPRLATPPRATKRLLHDGVVCAAGPVRHEASSFAPSHMRRARAAEAHESRPGAPAGRLAGTDAVDALSLLFVRWVGDNIERMIEENEMRARTAADTPRFIRSPPPIPLQRRIGDLASERPGARRRALEYFEGLIAGWVGGS